MMRERGMFMLGVQIESIAIARPAQVRDNDYYLEHFARRGKDISRLLEKVGRKTRYIATDEENSLTLGIEAALEALRRANITGKEIDLLIFSSQTPEFLVPMNSLAIHRAIDGSKEMVNFDLNANCIGMFLSIEQAVYTLQNNPHVERALVIGSDELSFLSNEKSTLTYSIFGDAAVALVLKKDSSNESGMLGIMHETDSENYDEIVYPVGGMKQLMKERRPHEGVYWGRFDGVDSVAFAERSIHSLLEENDLTIDDISLFCFSQFTLNNIIALKASLNIPSEKISYVGDRYGYTGTNSPFLAFYEALEERRVARGDYIIFWTLGAGYETATMLWKY